MFRVGISKVPLKDLFSNLDKAPFATFQLLKLPTTAISIAAFAVIVKVTLHIDLVLINYFLIGITISY